MNAQKLLSPLQMDETSSLPLHVQLTNALRDSLIQHRVKPGSPMPSERNIAELFQLNRKTVHRAYEQLYNEGYVESYPKRRGLFVSQEAKEKYHPDFGVIGIATSRSLKDIFQLNSSSQGTLNYLSGVIESAGELDYSSMIVKIPEDDISDEKLTLWLNKAIYNLVGIINFGCVHQTSRAAKALLECRRIPQVLIGAFSPFPHISSVVDDVVPGAVAAAKLLRYHKHRLIGMVIHPQPKIPFVFHDASENRHGIIKKCFSNSGLIIKPQWVFDITINEMEFVEHLKSVFTSPKAPTALWCQNDEIALRTIAILRQFGLRIPEDVSIIGFDDTRDAKNATPALTTIKLPFYTIGKCATDLIVQLFKQDIHGKAVHKTIPTSLVERDSVVIARQT